MVRWKVCGITRVQDALAAVEAGADAIGFVFHPPSPRYVCAEEAAEIARALPRRTWRVGVFVDHDPRRINGMIERVGLDFVQLSGDEPPATAAALARHAFKALRLGGGVTPTAALAQAQRYPECTLLVDAGVDGRYGGTGTVANWAAAAALARRYRLLLAGGLRPDNLAEAIRRVRPWGVDVSSGVESAPGRKDPALLRAFGRALEEFR